MLWLVQRSSTVGRCRDALHIPLAMDSPSEELVGRRGHVRGMTVNSNMERIYPWCDQRLKNALLRNLWGYTDAIKRQ